ncbi:protein NEGATIVE GRAVITROPIC RESPONSE OF ROOTS-like isoform X2 [Salvia miltiorrhiza]|uniref:protein NEGATIVE GRAVITROPIC RESPONSE OF ROOTS-like isoform X2 n=1 Tax=Salvia miltiorrhiza TaxID=226208 RepID=UPI0025AC4DEF|nr:protein NEGATIVE GRAVITROPIC RESPONSE OF ROOTS-like isoform X2 [Salvia miltiorrhiza]
MLVGIPSPIFLQFHPTNITNFTHTFFLEKKINKNKVRLIVAAKMKILSWMRSKRNGNGGSNNKPNPQSKSYEKTLMHESCNQEFSDWPNALLAIGTFGNKHSADLEQVVEKENLSVEQILNCLRDGDGRRLESQGSMVERAGKDIQSDKRNRGIGKTSLSFLLKKALLCGGAGFVAAPPIIRDPLPDPKLDHSTMEKILRAMLHKKIYPQRPTPKKCLDMGEEQECEKGTHQSKWDKTDSEYIVLEI